MKEYDDRFVTIFQDIYNSEFKTAYESNGLDFEHRQMDDMIAQVMKGEGGIVWACKNYDGDIAADYVA